MAQTKFKEGKANWDLSTLAHYRQVDVDKDPSIVQAPAEDGRPMEFLSRSSEDGTVAYCAKFPAPAKKGKADE